MCYILGQDDKALKEIRRASVMDKHLKLTFITGICCLSKFKTRQNMFLVNHDFYWGSWRFLLCPSYSTFHLLICWHINGSIIKTIVSLLGDPHSNMAHLAAQQCQGKRACWASCFYSVGWRALGNFISPLWWYVVSPFPNTCHVLSIFLRPFFSPGSIYVSIRMSGNLVPILLLTHL